MQQKKEKGELFDAWPDAYDRWFATPIGALVRKYEGEVILDLLRPGPNEWILDAGCGTGIFTFDFLSQGARMIGLDISFPMLVRAGQKIQGYPFAMVQGDMLHLPFPANSFDKIVSVTALEFIKDAQRSMEELFRVTKKGGWVVVATLNSLSPWAERRRTEAQKKNTIFTQAFFRSPDDLRSLAPVEGVIQTAVHFSKDEDPMRAPEIEERGRKAGLETGAFLAGRWPKP